MQSLLSEDVRKQRSVMCRSFRMLHSIVQADTETTNVIWYEAALWAVAWRHA